MESRILSGMRPTGKLHVGHFLGALDNWVELQDKYDSYFFVADYHALTTKSASEEIIQDTYDMVRDWISAGIDPNKSTVFIQSQVPEHAELHLLFSMGNTVSRLERMPTFKGLMNAVLHKGKEDAELSESEIKEAKGLISYGFLGYPVLQAADILMYKADKIPVGEDQLSHLELTKEIARKFNNSYGKTFPEPEGILTQSPKVPGTDGRKMSKSYNNTILPTDHGDDLFGKVRQMLTDPNRVRKTDKGDPEVCSVYDMHRTFSPGDILSKASSGCRTGTIGCIECKRHAANSIEEKFKDYRERRDSLNLSDSVIKEILFEGSRRARTEAQKTIAEVKEKMFLNY